MAADGGDLGVAEAVEGPPRELTDEELEKELGGLDKKDLVAMMIMARHEKVDMAQQMHHLRLNFQSAQREIDDYKEQAEQMRQGYETDLALLFDESTSLRAEMDFESTALTLDNERLREDLAAHAVLREQNQTLKESLEKMHQGMLDTQTAHHQEVEDLRDGLTVIKDKLYKEFRFRLHKMSGEMSGAMAGSGGTESAIAQVHAHNAHNASKAQETESHIKVIMDKYDQLESKHDKVKVAHGLVQQSMEFQTKEMLHRKRELLESRERCAALAHDLRDAQVMIAKCMKEMKTVNSLKEQIYNFEVQMRQLKEQVASGMRETLKWKTQAMKLKKEIRASTASAAREGTKTGGLVSASMSGKSRGSKLLPVVKRSHSGSTYGETVNQINHIEEERRSRGIDNGEESRSDAESGDESEWGEANLTRRASDTENLMGGTRSKAWLSASNSQSRLGAASTSPTMNYSRVYESTRQGVVSSVLSEDGDDDVKHIWSARFVAHEGGLHMGEGIAERRKDDLHDGADPRSESAPPARLDMTRSGSALGIGNYAQLYLPPAPRINGRRTDPVKMFDVASPDRVMKKKAKTRFLNFI